MQQEPPPKHMLYGTQHCEAGRCGDEVLSQTVLFAALEATVDATSKKMKNRPSWRDFILNTLTTSYTRRGKHGTLT